VTSGNGSERIKTLHITRNAGERPRVVMSLGPGRLPDLRRGDRVRLSAELQVTTNCNTRGPRCRGGIYHYNPRVRARLVLSSSAKATGGRRAKAVSPLNRETCTQKRPQYEHHCVLVFNRAGFRVGDRRRMPCAPNRCHVNLVASVHHPNAKPNDLLMVGGQRPSGHIPQDRGRVNAVRYRDTVASDFRVVGTRDPHRRRLRPDFRRRVVISKRLDGLQRHEQLLVTGMMRTDISHLSYATRTSAQLILAESPRATKESDFVQSHAYGFGEITENNGSNCTRPDNPCVYRKVGVLEMRRDSVDGQGRPKPLYVNYVTVIGPKKLRARARQRVHLRKTSLRVARFPPELRG
jgi:hypothetical protein